MRFKLLTFLSLIVFACCYGNNAMDNLLLSTSMQEEMAPYFLSIDHPLKPALDEIFLTTRATANLDSFQTAGFVTLHAQKKSYVRVASHPVAKGYLFKVYLDSETREKARTPGWKWLTQRCKGAKNIREIIAKEKLTHFVVPDKYIYALPSSPASPGPIAQPIVLVVTDMNLAGRDESRWAWKNLVTKEILEELYVILSQGEGSYYLPANIPYTNDGKFAFVDTEYPKRKLKLERVKRYLNDDMGVYWDQLMKSGGKKRS